MLGAGALGRPRGMEWGGRWEEGSGWGTHGIIYNNKLLYIILTIVIDNSINDKFLNHLDNYCFILEFFQRFENFEKKMFWGSCPHKFSKFP